MEDSVPEPAAAHTQVVGQNTSEVLENAGVSLASGVSASSDQADESAIQNLNVSTHRTELL